MKVATGVVWKPPFVTSWELYRIFHDAEIKPWGRLTKTEYKRFQRVLANRTELERVHFTIALRLSNLAPIEEEEPADVG